MVGEYFLRLCSILIVCFLCINGEETSSTLPGSITQESVENNQWNGRSPNPVALSTVTFSGNSFAQCELGSETTFLTHDLVLGSWGISLPSNSTILGIRLSLSKRGQNSRIIDNLIQIESGSFVSSNKSSADEWPQTTTRINYGGASDLWDVSQWTAEDIAGIVVRIRASKVLASASEARLYGVELTVTWEPSTATGDSTGIPTTGEGTTSGTTGRFTTGDPTTAVQTTGGTTGIGTTGELTTGATTGIPTTGTSTTGILETTATGESQDPGNAQQQSESGGGMWVIVGVVGLLVVLLIIVVVALGVFFLRKPQSKETSIPLESGFAASLVPMATVAHPKISTSAVRSAGLAEEPNVRFRTQMEDAHVIEDPYEDAASGFYAVFDGHGGKAVADFLATRLHVNLKSKMAEGLTPTVALKEAFLQTDAEIEEELPLGSGATAAVAWIRKEQGQRVIYSANVGDARTVLKRGSQAVRLSFDHKATDPSEIERIQKANGLVLQGKVGGSLAVARAFGDHEAKQWVICDPEIRREVLKSEDSHVVVACDGLWDVMTDEEAVGFLSEGSSQELAQSLILKAMERRTRDNVTVMVLEL